MTPKADGLGSVLPVHPYLGLVKEERACPVHFMLHQGELFLPSISERFRTKPVNSEDYGQQWIEIEVAEGVWHSRSFIQSPSGPLESKSTDT